jgi:hypothetical protein
MQVSFVNEAPGPIKKILFSGSLTEKRIKNGPYFMAFV